MSYPVRRRAQAEAELLVHIAWIAERNPGAAIRFTDAIEDTFKVLSLQPEIGAPHPSRNPRLRGLRKWVLPSFENYVLFYLFRGEHVDVLHVYRGERDYEDDLESGS